MLIEKVYPSGAWQISGIVDGHLVTRTYYGCTKREAKREFICEFPTVEMN